MIHRNSFSVQYGLIFSIFDGFYFFRPPFFNVVLNFLLFQLILNNENITKKLLNSPILFTEVCYHLNIVMRLEPEIKK